MNKRFIALMLLLMALPAARLMAQDGDGIEEGGGGGDDGGGGSSGGSSSDDDVLDGEWRDDGNWWWTEEEDDGNCEPDTSPPWLVFNIEPCDIDVDCPDDVPEAPTVTAWDSCDGGGSLSSSDVTNYNDAELPVSVFRSWSATDNAGNSSTWRQVINIRDTEYPVIDIKSEFEVQVDTTLGHAEMPDFSAFASDDSGYPYPIVTQTPGPGGKYLVGERQPVTLVAEDGCGRKATNFVNAIFVCGGCSGSCSIGSGTPENACVSLNLSLGRLANGRSAGHLSLFAQRPSARIFTPEALRYYKEGMGAETIRDTNGWLRQIHSAGVLVDIVTNNGYRFSYDIRFYSPSNWGSPGQSGLYVPSGPEYVTWRIFAPETIPFNGGTIVNSNRVMLSKVKGGADTRYEYLYDEDRQGWRLTSGMQFHHLNRGYYWDHGLKVESRYSTTSGATRTETYSIAASTSSPVAYLEVKEYRKFPWGEAWTKSIQGEGASARTTERGYYEDPLLPSRYARLAWERQPDGNFAWYDYDDQGRVVMEARACKDVDVPVLESNALMAAAAVTLYDFAPVDPADDGTVNLRKPRTVTELAANQIVSKTYFSFVACANGEIQEIKEECSTNGAAYGAAGNRRTRTAYYSDEEELWPSQVKSIEYPDGRLDRYVLERGTYEGGDLVPGTFTVGTGDYVRTTLIHGTMLHTNGTGKTTREVSVRRVPGGDVLRETHVFGSDGDHCVDWTVRNYDDQGHLVDERFANGLSRCNIWSDCCGKESDVDVDGTRMFYEYDALNRLATRTKAGVPKISSATEAGYPEQPDIVTTSVYDGAGNVVEEIQKAVLIQTAETSAGVVTQKIEKAEISSRACYDLAGRQVESRDASGLVTHYEYADGGRLATVIRPGGATEITENYPDGRVKSVTGTGVVPRFYDYGVNPDGSQWTMVRTGSTNSPMWEKTTTDMLGRTVNEEKPGFGGTLLTTTYDYNDKSQLVAVRQWEGNPPAAQIGTSTLYEYDEFGDQVRTAQDVNGNGAIDLDGPDRVTETKTRIGTISGERWRETISKVYAADGSSNSVTTSVQRRPMTGEGSGSSAMDSESVDIRGNVTATTHEIDPAQRIVTIRQNPPDSTVDAVTVVRNGLVHSSRPSIWRDPTYFAYDGLGRQVMVTDPRTGEHLTSYGIRNQIDATRDGAGNWTHYEYDPDTGLRISVSNALGDMVYTAYDMQGRPTNAWGATYPIAYEYDAYGRMAVMKTWRDTNAAPDVTRWLYDEATGLLTNKVYADGNGTSFEYDAAGHLTKRTWARGVATDYAYDALGQMTNIDYSDGTPDVSFTYNRMGRQVTVTDALGTRTNVYASAALDLVAECLPDGQTLARSYDSFGRPSGIALSNGYRVAYAYDDASRFMAITSSVNAVTAAVQYAYLAQSDLVSGWTIRDPSNSSAPSLDVKRVFEPGRDLVSSIVATNSTGYVAQYHYANDRLGRRFVRKDAIGETTVTNIFGYNSRSELDVAVMGTNQFGYQYDAIGNRQAAIANVSTNVYEANALNQYTSFLPADITPAYDADGNMTSDGTLSYVWDAENRLAEVLSNGTTIVRNAYDFMGRRVRKETGAATNAFLYDGWTLLREDLGAATPSSRFYLWGLDLSGTLQGAGGVGGLLCRIEGRDGSPSRPFFSFSDANGNVTGLVDTNGSIAARYDYDPYGNLLTQSGDEASSSPFRFSSKYCDDETGLSYYGYRFYSPQLGRWIGKDPIEEGGGANLYRFVGNIPINRIDFLGLWGSSVHEIKTAQWAKETGMRDRPPVWFFYYGRATDTVAWYCNGVDGGSTGPYPGQDQRYHFNRNGAEIDSRLELRDHHLQAAKNKCDWSMGSDDYDGAAYNLGLALHSVQDYVSHGDFFVGVQGEIGWPPHNGYSQADNVNGLDFWTKVHLVDDESLDAEGSSDHGRATTSVLQGSDPQKQWAKFVPGPERLSYTEERTKAVISDFIDHVKKKSKPCGACSQFFLP